MTFIDQGLLTYSKTGVWLLLVSLLWLSGSVAAGQSSHHQVTQLLHKTLEADKGPGLMVAVFKDNSLIYSEAVGMADLEQGVALTTNTKMRIGSVSKVLTAVASLRMVDADKLDVRANIQQYLPTFPAKQWSITAYHLGTHTSGIRHYNFNNYFEANNVRYYPTLEEALSAFSQESLLFQPGTQFEYSGFGLNLLGVVLEKANQTPFAQVIESYVTKPLNLANTVIDHPLLVTDNRTRFYTVSAAHGGAINTVWRDSSDYYPSGGMLSTAEDLAKFANMVFAGSFLSDASRTLMQQELTTPDGKSTGYAYGWQVIKQGKEVVFSHGGETNGAYAQVSYYPEHNLSIAGISNYNFWGAGLGEAQFFELMKTQLPAQFK